MKTYFKYFLIIGIMASSTNADAQWLKKLGNRLFKKAEQKTEQRLEKLGDKKTDKVLDSIFKERKPQKRKTKDSAQVDSPNSGLPNIMDGLPDIMGAMGKDVKINDTYTFHTTITMDRYGDGANPKDRTMIQRLSATATLTEAAGSKMIIDTENNAMITLLKNNQAQVMSTSMLDGFLGMDNESDEDQPYEEPVVTSTGSVVTIAGYQCQQKTITTSTQRIDLWYTDEVEVDMTAYMNMLKSLPSGSQNSQDVIKNNLTGFVMQMTVIDKKHDTHFSTKVTDISFEDTVINMSDYQLLKI